MVTCFPNQMKQARILPSRETLLATATPARFAQYVTRNRRDRWVMYPYLQLIDQMIIRAIRDAQSGRFSDPPIIIIELPPRHGKSELICRYLPVWFLGTYPEKRLLLAMNTENIARSYGRKCRNLMMEWGPQIFDIDLAGDSQAAGDWNIERRDGGMVAAGIGGAIGGRGAHCLIVDDPIRRAKDALSEFQRNEQWSWWDAEAYPRLEPGAIVIVVGTRWHEDDLQGRLEKNAATGDGPPVRRLRLPALAEADDPLGRAPGEPLCPARFSKEYLENLRDSKAPAWWNALYQQNPSEHEGAEWPPEYFADHIWSGEWPKPQDFILTAMAVDPSKGKATGDYAAVVFAGIAHGLAWIEADIEKRPIEKTVSVTIDMARPRRPMAVTVEGNGFQDLAMAGEFNRQYIERNNMAPLPIRMIDSREKKENRIRRLGTWLQQKKLRFRDSKGCRRLVQQLKEFPLSEHDDGPDALEMVFGTFQWLHGRGGEDGGHSTEYAPT